MGWGGEVLEAWSFLSLSSAKPACPAQMSKVLTSPCLCAHCQPADSQLFWPPWSPCAPCRVPTMDPPWYGPCVKQSQLRAHMPQMGSTSNLLRDCVQHQHIWAPSRSWINNTPCEFAHPAFFSGEGRHVEHVQGRNKPGRQPSSCRGFLSNPSSARGKLLVLTSLLSWPKVPLWLLSLAAGLNHVTVDEAPLASGGGGSFAAWAAVGELRINQHSQHMPWVQPWDCPKSVLPQTWGDTVVMDGVLL